MPMSAWNYDSLDIILLSIKYISLKYMNPESVLLVTEQDYCIFVSPSLQ